MRIVSRIREMIAASLMMLFIMYYVNATMFWHSHIINGVTIVHSHIHGSGHSSTPDGGHTDREVTLISVCSVIQMLNDCQHYERICSAIVLIAVFLISPTHHVCCPTNISRFLRAPPCCL